MSTAIVLTQNEIERIRELTRQIDEFAKKITFAEYQINRSPNTLKAQERDLKKFCEYINAIFDRDNLPLLTDLFRDVNQWQVITDGLVKTFRVWLLDSGYAVSTINRMIITIRVYARLAWHSGVLDSEHYRRIDAIENFTNDFYIDEKREDSGKPTRKSAEKEHANFLTVEQVAKLKTLQDTKPINLRDRLMICFLADLGLRANEVAALKISDIDFANKTIRVYRRKTKTTDLLTYRNYDVLLDALTAYEPYILEDKDAPLLRSSRTNGELTNQPMTRITVSRRVQTLGRNILNMQNLSSHDLRHTFAKNEYLSGSDVIAIKRAGGWQTTAMVDLYIGDFDIANDGLKGNQ